MKSSFGLGLLITFAGAVIIVVIAFLGAFCIVYTILRRIDNILVNYNGWPFVEDIL